MMMFWRLANGTSSILSPGDSQELNYLRLTLVDDDDFNDGESPLVMVRKRGRQFFRLTKLSHSINLWLKMGRRGRVIRLNTLKLIIIKRQRAGPFDEGKGEMREKGCK